MPLDILRYLKHDEQERALNLVRLLDAPTPVLVEQARLEDVCERDREFLRRLQALVQVDATILRRLLIVRAKIRLGLPVLSHEWEELLLTLNFKGFYDSGVNLRYASFHGSVDLRGAVIGGDYDASYSTVLGDCNEQQMLVLGTIVEDGRVVRGDHRIGAQVRLEDYTAAASIPRPIADYDVDLSELEDEARVTASGDRISLGIKVTIDFDARSGSTPTRDELGRNRFPSDPTTLRSVTPDELRRWREALVRSTGELITEADILPLHGGRLRPPPKPRALLRPRSAGALAKTRALLEREARGGGLKTSGAAPRTRRGASRGQSIPPSLRSIDQGWDPDDER